jgi:glycosyltransferase involved in cell wall biosynthesis
MRIAFTLLGDSSWTGGVNYLRNILFSLKELGDKDVEPVLFVAPDTDQKVVDSLKPYVKEIVKESAYKRWTPRWFVSMSTRRALDRDVEVERLFIKHSIDVVFHSGLLGEGFRLPCVNWIPDFQHLHMPEMFSERDIKYRDKLFLDLSRMCERLVVSSETAREDFEKSLPKFKDKVDVLNFVARIPEEVFLSDPVESLSEYKLPEKFFHLPNQFWKHKNHMLVIEALKMIKDRGEAVDIFVVCTGSEKDFRHPDYFASIKDRIKEYGLEDSIFLLGLVPINDLYQLMRRSVAVINPSFFEGWSTTVEESKSLGKSVLLSDIQVHREQNPEGGLFFDPFDSAGLAEVMISVWKLALPGPDKDKEREARERLNGRVREFGRLFVDIIRKAEKEGIKR